MKFKEGDKAHLPVYITRLAGETDTLYVSTKRGFTFTVDENELTPDFGLDKIINGKGLYIKTDEHTGNVGVRRDRYRRDGYLIAYFSFDDLSYHLRHPMVGDIDTQILGLWMLKRYLNDERTS